MPLPEHTLAYSLKNFSGHLKHRPSRQRWAISSWDRRLNRSAGAGTLIGTPGVAPGLTVTIGGGGIKALEDGHSGTRRWSEDTSTSSRKWCWRNVDSRNAMACLGMKLREAWRVRQRIKMEEATPEGPWPRQLAGLPQDRRPHHSRERENGVEQILVSLQTLWAGRHSVTLLLSTRPN